MMNTDLKSIQKQRFEKAKSLDLRSYVEHVLGLEFEKQSKASEFWYKSPFVNTRQQTASFHIDTNRNVWFDFAVGGKGGDLTDLVAKINNCTLYEALDIVDKFGELPKPKSKPVKAKNSFSFHGSSTTGHGSKTAKLHALKDIGNNKAISKYIVKERGIPLDLARLYLEEIYFYFPGYKDKKNILFGAGIENDFGGYEVRNPHIKTAVNYKTFTLIRGSEGQELSIFEGFFDFLAALAYTKLSKPRNDTIILNSLSFLKSTGVQIGVPYYERVNLFLDNDPAGDQATAWQFGASIDPKTGLARARDCRYIYKGAKDFNAFWLQKIV